MYVDPTGHEYWNSQYVDGDAFPYLGPAYDVDFAGGAVMNGLVRPLYNMSSGAINEVWNVHRYGMFESDLQAFCFLSLMPEAQGALGSFGKSVGTIWDGLASRLSFAPKGAITLDANAIRFSQSNVRATLPEITKSMKGNGWQGSPIDVVRMSDGALTVVDNTRLAAASLSKTPVQAIIRNFDEVFPATRAGGNLQGTTWEEAVLNRIGGQKPAWQRLYPNGSPFTGIHP